MVTPIVPDMNAKIMNASDEVVNWPQTSGDGDPTKKTPLLNPNILTPGYLFYGTGAFDNIATGKRGEGVLLEMEQGEAGLQILDGQFIEHVYIHGGDFGAEGNAKGDWVQMMAWAPASVPTDRTSEQDGNADKVGIAGVVSVSGTFQIGETVTGGTSGHTGKVVSLPEDNQMKIMNASGSFEQGETITGGTSGATAAVAATIAVNMIVPNGGSTGWWNVDTSAMLVGEINENLVPVPDENSPQVGYWNWDCDASPSITPAAGDGSFNLYDQPLPLVRQANRILCICKHKDCCPEALKGKKFLPHWKIRFYVNRATVGSLWVGFTLKTSRRKTTNLTDLA